MLKKSARFKHAFYFLHLKIIIQCAKNQHHHHNVHHYKIKGIAGDICKALLYFY